MEAGYTKRQEDVDLAKLSVKVDYIADKLDGIDEVLKHNYVTAEAFEPIKRIVYGLVGVILVSFVGAVIALIIK